MIQLTECPRDAMQGIKMQIPTDEKISYIQSLLEVNFNYLDCGSFVSPRVIPQMADTHQVLSALDLSETATQLTVVVANRRGAELAAQEEKISLMGFPFSMSEKFQQYNTNSGREEGIRRISLIQEIIAGSGKELMIYLSMGFGNPYGEAWSTDLVKEYVSRFVDMGIRTFKLSDTVGAAQTEDISALFRDLKKAYPQVELGAHFHTVYADYHEKLVAAYAAGCRNFDGAIQGRGGCPMSKSQMVGNMPSEKLITFVHENQLEHQIDTLAFENAFNKALTLFEKYH